jgi:hypothetical protein
MRGKLGQYVLNITTIVVLLCGFVIHGLASGSPTIGSLASQILVAYLTLWSLYTFFSDDPRAELRRRFVLMTGTFVLMLGMTEVLAWSRVVDYRLVFATTPVPWWLSSYYIFDEEFLWRHVPGSRIRTSYQGNKYPYVCVPPSSSREVYEVQYDRRGFRNDEELEQADIAVVGDSFVEGAQVRQPMLMTFHLHTLMGVRVANLGVTGYGPQQELLVAKRYAMGLHPTTLVWMFYEGNDLRDMDDYVRDRARFSSLMEQYTSLWQRSFTRNALEGMARLLRGCVPDPLLVKRYIKLQVNGDVRPVYVLDAMQPVSPKEEEALRQLKTILSEVYHLCREHGMRLLVVFAPQEYRVYHGLPQVVARSEEVEHWHVNTLPVRVRQIGRDIAPDIQYLDLTPTLRQAAAEGTAVFLWDDNHWTAAGHRIAAEAISHTLKRTGFQ